jgi:ADP-ribosyl-[dinitrogen reductase] hydrolase
MTKNLDPSIVRSCFLGLAIGDALGVPVEFRDRSFLTEFPVREMLGYGVWNQPPGTWSDDSSLTFCLAESLSSGYDINDIGKKFVAWYEKGYWGAHHKLFDIGGTTRTALERLRVGVDPLASGERGENSNGNGSLMRIAPAAIYFRNLSNDELLERIGEVSSLTHAHFRSIMACLIYSIFIRELLSGYSKFESLTRTIVSVKQLHEKHQFDNDEMRTFTWVLDKPIQLASEQAIQGSGYVIHTLEASLWCFLTTETFSEAVLKAVNLGQDTDTTGCVTGALAGLYYGESSIPPEWRSTLAREKDIVQLAENFSASCNSGNNW